LLKHWIHPISHILNPISHISPPTFALTIGSGVYKKAPMNVLDVLILAILIFFLIRGIFRGFFKEIGSLAGIILGIVLGIRFNVEVAGFLGIYVPATRFLPLIGFGMIFVGTLIGCNLLALALRALTQKALLGWLDRTMGAGLALFKGVILTYVIIVLLTFFFPSGALLMGRSVVAPWIVSSYQAMANMVSPEAYQSWKKRFTPEGSSSAANTLRQEGPTTHGSR
jgi:membrane protein required for colicin V production